MSTFSGIPQRLGDVYRSSTGAPKDPTAPYRAEEVFTTEELFQVLVKEADTIAFAMLDRVGRVTFWNRGAEKIFGYPEQEILGKDFRILFPPEDRDLGVPKKELRTALERGLAPNERWLQKKDGSRFWASGHSNPLRNDHGEVLGFAKYVREETTRRTTQDELQRAYAHLNEFVTIASHDLREPLRTVLSYMQLLDLEVGSTLVPKAKSYLATAVEGAKRMDTLFETLLSYLSAGRRKAKPEQVDPNVLVDNVFGTLGHALEKSGATVTRSLLPGVPAVAIELTEVFQNLISNAIKYQQKGKVPEVQVDFTASEDEVVFSVRDNGIGIAPQDQQRVFEEFERVSDRSEYPGTGLGLSICKKIIERHGGKMWVTSELGSGSTFFFSLPKK